MLKVSTAVVKQRCAASPHGSDRRPRRIHLAGLVQWPVLLTCNYCPRQSEGEDAPRAKWPRVAGSLSTTSGPLVLPAMIPLPGTVS